MVDSVRYFYDLEREGGIDGFLEDVPADELVLKIEKSFGKVPVEGYPDNFFEGITVDYEGKVIRAEPKYGVIQRTGSIDDKGNMNTDGSEIMALGTASKIYVPEEGKGIMYIDKLLVVPEFRGMIVEKWGDEFYDFLGVPEEQRDYREKRLGEDLLNFMIALSHNEFGGMMGLRATNGNVRAMKTYFRASNGTLAPDSNNGDYTLFSTPALRNGGNYDIFSGFAMQKESDFQPNL